VTTPELAAQLWSVWWHERWTGRRERDWSQLYDYEQIQWLAVAQETRRYADAQCERMLANVLNLKERV
jgi:hypothetical protein